MGAPHGLEPMPLGCKALDQDGVIASCPLSFTDAEEPHLAEGAGRVGPVPAGAQANLEPATEPKVGRVPWEGRKGLAGGGPHPATQCPSVSQGPECT